MPDKRPPYLEPILVLEQSQVDEIHARGRENEDVSKEGEDPVDLELIAVDRCEPEPPGLPMGVVLSLGHSFDTEVVGLDDRYFDYRDYQRDHEKEPEEELLPE